MLSVFIVQLVRCQSPHRGRWLRGIHRGRRLRGIWWAAVVALQARHVLKLLSLFRQVMLFIQLIRMKARWCERVRQEQLRGCTPAGHAPGLALMACVRGARHMARAACLPRPREVAQAGEGMMSPRGRGEVGHAPGPAPLACLRRARRVAGAAQRTLFRQRTRGRVGLSP